MADKDVALGFGIAFAVGDGAEPTEAFTTVGQVSNFPMPTESRDSVDVTANDSPNKYREFIPGLRDGGEVPLEIEFSPGNTEQSLLYDHYKDDDCHNYQITVPAVGADPAAVVVFRGFLTAITPEGSMEDKMMLNCTFKVTGEPAWTNFGS